MLCRADKSLAAQRKLDSSVCRQEVNEAHLSLIQQMEMVSRILSTMSDILLSDADNRKDNPRQLRQDLTEQMLKDIDKQMTNVQAMFMRSFTEKNRTSFELINHNINEIHKTIDGITVAAGGRWNELSAQQLSLFANVTSMALRSESLSESQTSLDGRLTNISHLVSEQVVHQQKLLTERVESSLYELQRNLSALQAHIKELVEVRLENISSFTVPKLINDSCEQTTELVTKYLKNASLLQQQSLVSVIETWQEQHRYQRELILSGLNATLSLANETAQQIVNATSQALLEHMNEHLQSSLHELLQNISSLLQGNVAEVEDKVYIQFQRLQNQTLTALQNYHLTHQDLRRSFNQSLVSWQQTFNASMVEVLVTQAIQQWNSTALFPFWNEQWHELRAQHATEATTWRDSLRIKSQLVQQIMTNFTIDQTQLISQQLYSMLAREVSYFNDTLQSSLDIWFKKWNTTKQHIDTSLDTTISSLTTAVHRNVSLVIELADLTNHALRVNMSALIVNMSNSMQLLQERSQHHLHLLQQNMTKLQDAWQHDMNVVQSNVSAQLGFHGVELQRFLQTDASQRVSEHQNFTSLLQARLNEQSQQLLSWQAQWHNQTDTTVQQAYDAMYTLQKKDVTNVTTFLTERWMQLITATALLQERTTEAHELLRQQQAHSQAQQVTLALLQQTQHVHVLPQLGKSQQQWRNWSEGLWPSWQHDSHLWRQEYAQKTQTVQEAQNVCQEKWDEQEQQVVRLKNKVLAMEQTEEARKRTYEAHAKQRNEDIRKLRSESDATKALIERIAAEQSTMKQEQDRMQEFLINQAMLLLKAQSVK
jgi:hypothetical protein